MSRQNPAQTFLIEAEDLLGKIEEISLEVRPGEPPGESIHQLFRAFHTIKGSGAMFGFDAVAQFTHHVESVLDKVRDGVVPISEDLINLILRSKDQIKALLDAAQAGSAAPVETGKSIIAGLNALLPDQRAEAPAKAGGAPAEPGPAAGSGPALQSYRISFKPDPGLMISGTNPLMLLNELRGLGACTVVANAEGVPPLEELSPDQCYLAWDITLLTDRGLNAIKDVFIFVEDGSGLSIQPELPRPAATEPASVNKTPAEQDGSGRELTVPPEKAAAGRAIAGAPCTAAERSAPAPVPGQAARGSASGPPSQGQRDSTTRVPSERLDRLVTLVGEMVMNQSRLTQVAAAAGLPNLSGPVEELERLVAELRDNVLGIRMMPIGATFSRYKRLVHDLSAELGKEIDLVTEGAETELDKTVLDQLGDPLVHLIRNSIDHGVESADTRQRAGKPGRGTIRLAAAHTGSNVVITIQDDGRGLDTEAIRAKAVEKRLISSETAMSREEIFNLIFLPGFSTARQVTSVSGRGVGMDVVRRQIDSLRGSIQLASEQGRGTTISLTLPLTLAIIDGLLVEIGSDQFIIPMSTVAENVELARADRARNNGRNLVSVRGELVSYLRLRELFGMSGDGLDVEKIVVVRHGSERVGLVVDRVLGSHQTVIQSLGRFYRDIDVISGATIMGDGRVALILDLSGVLRFADRGRRESGWETKTMQTDHE